MPIIHEFEYVKAADLTEAVSVLSRGAAVLAGGTDLVNMLKDQAHCIAGAIPQTIVDIKGVAALRGIEMRGDDLCIGALATFTEIIESPLVKAHFPLLAEVSETVGSIAVRNRATMAGNICSAVPCTDSGPVLCAYDARLELVGPEGERTVEMANWFVRPRETSIRPGELLARIIVPRPAERHGGAFAKLMRYAGEDLAQASVCVLALPDHVYRVSFGSVAPTPIRSLRLEQMLAGQAVSDALVEKAKAFIPEEIAPISDVRASREYRMEMVKVMFERAIKAAAERLAGDGPPYGTRFI